MARHRSYENRQLRRLFWWLGLLLFGLAAAAAASGQLLLNSPILVGPLLSFWFVLPPSFSQSLLIMALFGAGLGCWITLLVLWWRREPRTNRPHIWQRIATVLVPVIAAVTIWGVGFVAIFAFLDAASIFNRDTLVVPVIPASITESQTNTLSPLSALSPNGCRVVLDTHFVLMGPWVTEIYVTNPGTRQLSQQGSIPISDEQVSAIAYSSVRWQDSYANGTEYGTVFITGPNVEVSVTCPFQSDPALLPTQG